MSDKKLSRNKKYELKQEAAGLKKVTLWVPKEAVPDFQSMSQYCVENKDCSPFMVRCASTGRMRKAV